ncbi:MAG TPA: T9SS type A sorting domain-containing protein, partial [Bacteroidaceae bacterium]|nr:T9SS type A sorting domain-containing protein [Bacteroidaceae bacterium]
PYYPVQRNNVSYGIIDGHHTFFETPTPGYENTLGDQVFSPVFSKTRGFYKSPFELQLSVGDPGLKIYYTTDGTRPDAMNAILYEAPIQIETTTPLSAVAIDISGHSSEVITHTFLFAEDIVQQPDNPPGYPSEWSPFKYTAGNAPADYEMDPEVCNNPEYQPLMESSLTSIPTLSLVTDIGNLFSHSTDPETGGIYIYTGNSGASPSSLGIDWERQISAEYIDPVNNSNFQINCGLKLHGGNSRVPMNSQKHSFRLVFRSEYGPKKLNYNLFDDKRGADNEFNTLVLRAGYNYSWMHNNVEQRIHTSFIQDPFAKNTQLDMGDPSPHNKFVHLYLNGLYWGLYCITEKVNNDFAESYMGGKEDDYDVVKDHSGLVDGNRTAWDQLLNQTKAGFSSNAAYFKVQGRNPDGSINPVYANLLDVDNLINYIIFNVYIGNNDWDHNNWLAARNRVKNDIGFRFFSWDAENSLTDKYVNMVNDIQGEPTTIYSALRSNEEFGLRFADHLREHFFNGGALTSSAAGERFRELAGKIDLAVIAESARWGDYRRDTHPRDDVAVLYTRNDHWKVEIHMLQSDYFPDRSDIVFQQFRNEGLYPGIDAPDFSHYGGKLKEPVYLEMSANKGEIYFTDNDSDPRAIGGDISSSRVTLYSGPVLIDSTMVIKARAKSGNDWSAMTMATFNVVSEPLSKTDLIIGDLLNVNLYPNPFNAHLTIQYNLPENGHLKIQIISMDGRVVAELYDGLQIIGNHSVTWQPETLKSGIYFYRLVFNRSIVAGKIIKTD